MTTKEIEQLRILLNKLSRYVETQANITAQQCKVISQSQAVCQQFAADNHIIHAVNELINLVEIKTQNHPH